MTRAENSGGRPHISIAKVRAPEKENGLSLGTGSPILCMVEHGRIKHHTTPPGEDPSLSLLLQCIIITTHTSLFFPPGSAFPPTLDPVYDDPCYWVTPKSWRGKRQDFNTTASGSTISIGKDFLSESLIIPRCLS